LVFGLAAVDPILRLVLRPDVSAEVSAVEFNVTMQSAFATGKLYGLTQLVKQNESALVIAAKVTRKLKRGIALGTVREDRDRAENVAELELAAVKDRARCQAELLRASLTLPNRTALKVIMVQASTFRANGLAVRLVPADRGEGFLSLFVGHAQDFR